MHRISFPWSDWSGYRHITQACVAACESGGHVVQAIGMTNQEPSLFGEVGNCCLYLWKPNNSRSKTIYFLLCALITWAVATVGRWGCVVFQTEFGNIVVSVTILSLSDQIIQNILIEWCVYSFCFPCLTSRRLMSLVFTSKTLSTLRTSWIWPPSSMHREGTFLQVCHFC